MIDYEESEAIEAIARDSADQPLLKTCPLCRKDELTLVINLVNARRQGRIRGQREYFCVNCEADIAVHFAPIKRRLKSEDLPVFCQTGKTKAAPEETLKLEIPEPRCERTQNCMLPAGHRPTTWCSPNRHYERRWKPGGIDMKTYRR